MLLLELHMHQLLLLFFVSTVILPPSFFIVLELGLVDLECVALLAEDSRVDLIVVSFESAHIAIKLLNDEELLALLCDVDVHLLEALVHVQEVVGLGVLLIVLPK